ncbi:KamA family radical SAM protein [Inmirania thermothiophila]|uniref:L-lysine 2,3-aminomutase n=1 Tax=Inmirania thermothiophila TaxID=1750597 RepID=A0A3N1Y691_9GAMM|nr:lysine 2,3-aminomutase [Inmirania thermothiophila]ROR34324.1 L-lysine 2,3-aminomutase [Inmirania thermothiophila]
MTGISRTGLARPVIRPSPRRLEVYTARHLPAIPELARLDPDHRFAMEVVARVLPFRVNRYVIEELIDWGRVPEDPVFRLTFPQPGMLEPEDFRRIAALLRRGAPEAEIAAAVAAVRARLNPHPAGQRRLNVPRLQGRRLQGLQHKYRETVLFFPAQGQTCHSYCSFCFRWPQFVGERELRFAERDAASLQAYLRAHPEVTDLLVTGGDPMVMRTQHLAAYLEPLLTPAFAHVTDIRIGTKALSFWPFRFLTDPDADALLRLFERIVAAGRHLAVMAHVNHPQELESEAAREAIARIRATGAEIRTQAPLLRHINDDPAVWARMWREQVRLGMIPYYMFVERDTGARRYFELPLARAHAIYREAIARVSGLARTVRGPSMSATPGKVEVQGVAEVAGERVFVLRFLQARDPDWLHRPFFARYDAEATWLDQLRPAFGEAEFFFEPGLRAMAARAGAA